VVWEDRVNPDLLFVGNDTGVFVTIDGGGHWVKMNNNMPNVPVHDLLVHPREADLVVGSYGRGIFVTNVSPLQELGEDVLARESYLFSVKPTVQRVPWSFGANDYLFADAHIETRNEPNGMSVWYYLGSAADGPVTVTVSDASGNELARLEGETGPGIHQVLWNMRPRGPGGGFGGGGGGGPLDRLVPPGEYRVTLEVGGDRLTQTATVTGTQGWSLGPFPRVIR
jgi:hypothetical protein